MSTLKNELEEPLVSVVIRTKNSANTLAACLNALSMQSVEVKDIIIVDSGSTDATLSIAEEHCCQIIHYPTSEFFNYSKSLNLGISKAQHPYILLLSSHVLLQYIDSIHWMRYFLLESQLFRTVSLNRSSKRTVEHELLSLRELRWTIINKSNFRGQGMYNYCSMIRKIDWSTRPFDVSIPTCEDQDWINKAIQAENIGAVFIKFPFVYYDNPYYNLSKDIREHIVIAQKVHPYMGSLPFIRKKYGSSFRYLRRLDWTNAKNEILLATYLLKNKFFPIDIEQFESIYNERLK